MDWFDIDTTDGERNSSFDIGKFEELPRFPEQRYTLGVVIKDMSDSGNDVVDRTFDKLAEEMSIFESRQQKDSESVRCFLNALSSPEDGKESMYEELRETQQRSDTMTTKEKGVHTE